MRLHTKLLLHGILLIISGLVLAVLFMPVISKSSLVTDLEAKIARHQISLARQDARPASQNRFSTALIVTGDLSAERLNMQQSLSGILRSTDARLDRMRQLPDQSTQANEAVELRVQVQWSGDLQTIIETLTAIDALRPMMFAEQLTLNAGPAGREDRLIRADATFVRLWTQTGTQP